MEKATISSSNLVCHDNKQKPKSRTDQFFILEWNRKCYWTTSIRQEAKDIVHTCVKCQWESWGSIQAARSSSSCIPFEFNQPIRSQLRALTILELFEFELKVQKAAAFV